MDFTKGMKCPNCDNHNSFYGGHFGGGVNTTNYNCGCGFSAILVINWKQQWESFEIRGVRAKGCMDDDEI